MNNSTINLCLNASLNTLTEEYWKLDRFRVIPGQVTAAIMLCFIVVGVPWNIMVVITAIKKRLYHNPTILLLLNLVLTDILLLLFQLPIMTLTGIAGEYILGSTDSMRCQTCFAGFIQVTLMIDSLFVVALMSIDRFLFIYKPLLYEQKATKQRTLLTIALTTMLSIGIGLLSFITRDTISFSMLYLSCTINTSNHWYTILVITFSCIALIVIMVCNIWVIYIVQKNIREVYSISRSLSSKDKRMSHIQQLSERIREERHKKQLHLFRAFGGLLLSNSVCWFPTVLLFVLYMLSVSTTDWIVYLSNIIFMSQVAVHPILESFLIRDVRIPLKEMITCGLVTKNDDFATPEEQNCSYSLCCRSTEDSSCSFMFKLIDTAVLPRDNSSLNGIIIHSVNRTGGGPAGTHCNGNTL